MVFPTRAVWFDAHFEDIVDYFFNMVHIVKQCGYLSAKYHLYRSFGEGVS